MGEQLVEINGVVVPGTRAASGSLCLSDVGGTICAQKPLFLKAGLDLTAYYNGTININIFPLSYRIIQPDYVIPGVKWGPDLPAENFSFVRCCVTWKGLMYSGYIYHPHPSTKIGTFPGYNILEVISSFIPGLGYGSSVKLGIKEGAIIFQ